AVDFLEKPIDHARLMSAIDEAFARQDLRQDDQERNAATASLLDTLTPREREVMEQVVAGRHNREIAHALDISPRTVEVHKARLLAKLQVDSIADLVRLSLRVAGKSRG
nr:sigma-70 family RNA polymerase sigma factor [Accumulibacter sp.]